MAYLTNDKNAYYTNAVLFSEDYEESVSKDKEVLYNWKVVQQSKVAVENNEILEKRFFVVKINQSFLLSIKKTRDDDLIAEMMAIEEKHEYANRTQARAAMLRLAKVKGEPAHVFRRVVLSNAELEALKAAPHCK